MPAKGWISTIRSLFFLWHKYSRWDKESDFQVTWLQMLSTDHSCQNVPQATTKCSDFALEALPDLLGLKSHCIRYWINPVVKLEKLCKKLNFAYAIAHLFCRIGFFCSSPGWWTVPDMTWETADWFWSGSKATSQSRDCYPCTNVTRPVIQLREPKYIPSYSI